MGDLGDRRVKDLTPTTESMKLFLQKMKEILDLFKILGLRRLELAKTLVFLTWFLQVTLPQNQETYRSLNGCEQMTSVPSTICFEVLRFIYAQQMWVGNHWRDVRKTVVRKILDRKHGFWTRISTVHGLGHSQSSVIPTWYFSFWATQLHSFLARWSCDVTDMRKVEVRGVWWIDFGPGVVTVDLNRLEQSSESEFYAQELEMRVLGCSFVCLFVGLFACSLFVCLFVCLFVSPTKSGESLIKNGWNGWSDLVPMKWWSKGSWDEVSGHPSSNLPQRWKGWIWRRKLMDWKGDHFLERQRCTFAHV